MIFLDVGSKNHTGCFRNGKHALTDSKEIEKVEQASTEWFVDDA